MRIGKSAIAGAQNTIRRSISATDKGSLLLRQIARPCIIADRFTVEGNADSICLLVSAVPARAYAFWVR
jgi:hypothetical protein